MSAVQLILAFAVASTILSGCGTYVPDIEDFPSGPENRNRFIRGIVKNITCEVRDALAKIYTERTQYTFLDNWGVQMTLNLQLDEKSEANPVVNWTPPSPASALFNLGAGSTLSSAATRIDKMNFFFTVPELRSYQKCEDVERPGGPMLMQSDLKLYDWIVANLQASATGANLYSRNQPGGQFGHDVFSHEVRFEVLTSGGITPGWKLSRLDINQSGTFLSASRTRTHDLTITFGPTELTKQSRVIAGRPVLLRVVGPSQAASQSHFTSQVGVAVANGLQIGLRR
ncbi:MAG: hypothetical protein ABWY18_08645 [Tardiphaga sp.]